MQHVGVDIIEIDRVDAVIKRWGQTFLRRVFTPLELEKYKTVPSLAARFAAKEAVLKTLGVCDHGISWQDIEILSEPSGKPVVNLAGNAKLHAAEAAISRINISLSHSRDYAVAFAVGETA
jgi:phosphopantetheine--protein transferase-like protein